MAGLQFLPWVTCAVASLDWFLSLAGTCPAVRLVGRLVSDAYQPSVAVSASIAAWSKCQSSVDRPLWSV